MLNVKDKRCNHLSMIPNVKAEGRLVLHLRAWSITICKANSLWLFQRDCCYVVFTRKKGTDERSIRTGVV